MQKKLAWLLHHLTILIFSPYYNIIKKWYLAQKKYLTTHRRNIYIRRTNPSNVQSYKEKFNHRSRMPNLLKSKDHMVAGELFLQLFSPTTWPECQLSTRMLLNINFTRMKIPAIPEWASMFPEIIFLSGFKKVRRYFTRLAIKLCSQVTSRLVVLKV